MRLGVRGWVCKAGCARSQSTRSQSTRSQCARGQKYEVKVGQCEVRCARSQSTRLKKYKVNSKVGGRNSTRSQVQGRRCDVRVARS